MSSAYSFHIFGLQLQELPCVPIFHVEIGNYRAAHSCSKFLLHNGAIGDEVSCVAHELN